MVQTWRRQQEQEGGGKQKQEAEGRQEQEGKEAAYPPKAYPRDCVEGPHPKGWLAMFLVFSVWASSVFILPGAACAWFMYDARWPAYVLVLYYSLRMLWPAKSHADSIYKFLNIEGNLPIAQHSLVFADEDDAGLPGHDGRPFLVGFHPHGVLCIGGCISSARSVFRDRSVVYLATSVLFNGLLPGIRDIFVWLGGQSVAKDNMAKLLGERTNIGMAVGGFEEATLFRRGRNRVFIKTRKGFVKLALVSGQGYTLYPSFTFNEDRTYFTPGPLTDVCQGLRLWLNQFGLPGVLAAGYLGSFLPDPHVRLATVVGKGIRLPLRGELPPEEVTQAHIDDFHRQYLKSLCDVFEQFKGEFAHDGQDAKLEVY